MSLQHKTLSEGRWNTLSFPEQMANLGSEVFRTIQWKRKKNPSYAQAAFERSLELFDITLADPKNQGRLREISRARELWADSFAGSNAYGSTDQSWERYFMGFSHLAQQGK